MNNESPQFETLLTREEMYDAKMRIDDIVNLYKENPSKIYSINIEHQCLNEIDAEKLINMDSKDVLKQFEVTEGSILDLGYQLHSFIWVNYYAIYRLFMLMHVKYHNMLKN